VIPRLTCRRPVFVSGETVNRSKRMVRPAARSGTVRAGKPASMGADWSRLAAVPEELDGTSLASEETLESVGATLVEEVAAPALEVRGSAA